LAGVQDLSWQMRQNDSEYSFFPDITDFFHALESKIYLGMADAPERQSE